MCEALCLYLLLGWLLRLALHARSMAVMRSRKEGLSMTLSTALFLIRYSMMRVWPLPAAKSRGVMPKV